ncbi:MAG TPA: DUF4350 domain-containing protein [Anaerolineae bacterium]|nr:DUF4350 domain-containing protein [Anaerolineae bacterium]
MKKLVLVLAALALLLLPLLARWLYYYDPGAGSRRPAVARPDLSQVAEPALAPQDFEDSPAAGTPGTVLVDLAHENRVQMAELGVLQARLAARGQSLEPLTDAAELGSRLRGARALVVASPGTAWTADEIEQVVEFVDKGGRLLLVTDPSRYDVLYDEWGSFSALDPDVAHMNDLAARFGLVFQADYLYNTLENEGNYRHIRLTDFTSHPLTEGLEQVVLLGTHSIVSQEGALVWTEGDTRSSSSERTGSLTVAALAAGGQVLALGDLSFLLEPYNTLYDNDRLIANIADLLAGADRRYQLEDFPFFFEGEVDLVYAGDPLLNPKLMAAASGLQDHLAEQGLSPALRAVEDQERDTLLLGLFEDADEAEPYLSALGVTLTITPAGETAEDAEAPVTEDDAEDAAPAVDRIEIEGLGEVEARGNALLALQEEGDRQVLLVLAAAEESLGHAVERLAAGDLEGCLFGEDGGLALCPVEEAAGDREERPEAEEEPAEAGPSVPEGEEPAPSVPEGEEPAGAGAAILLLSLDAGQGRYDNMTGVDEFERILEEHYAVSTWSTAAQGLPEMDDLRDYDLVIWTAGDFEDAFGEPESGLLFALMLEEIPVLVSGAYIGSAEEQAVQRDLQVKDASHPLAQGFAPDEVIPFVEAPSGSEYEIDVLSDLDDGESDVVFVRGPGSESSGVASMAVISDAVSSTRVVFAGFPLYLLPEPARSRLVLNAVSWMLGAGEG